jgi:GGDEF domain-containing protein
MLHARMLRQKALHTRRSRPVNGKRQLGTASTTLSTWGYIPFSDWTFRAIEIGMLVDATLLALALAQQFRENQVERILAEQLAGIDSLTGLKNRRAFQEKAQSIWSTALLKQRKYH